MVQSKMESGEEADLDEMDPNDPIHSLGTNLLKVSVGLSALVFIIMLQAHHNHQDNTAHGGYVLGLCHNIAVEMFDSVRDVDALSLASYKPFFQATLLSLLIVPDKDLNYLKIWNFNHVIIILSSINLILPTLTLYSMSMSDFGRRLTKVSKLTVASQLLNLLVINLPFLVIRLYLWYDFSPSTIVLTTLTLSFCFRAKYNYELSLFVVKNLCYIFLLVHSLYPGMARLFTKWQKKRELVDFSNAPKVLIEEEETDGGTRPKRRSFERAMASGLDTSRESIQMVSVNQPSTSTT